jgi:exodeoxyribonuclease VII small subunit
MEEKNTAVDNMLTSFSESVQNMTFDEALKAMDEALDKLEESDTETEETEILYTKAVILRERCADILEEEREEIKKIAEESGIPLSELGLDDKEGTAES